MVRWDTRRALQLRIFAYKSSLVWAPMIFEQKIRQKQKLRQPIWANFRLNAKYIDGDDNFDGTDGDDDSDDVQEGWWAMVPCGNSTLKTWGGHFLHVPHTKVWSWWRGWGCDARDEDDDKGRSKKITFDKIYSFSNDMLHWYGDDAGHGRDDNGKWQRKSSLDIESLKWEYFDKSTLSIVAGNIINNHWGLLQKTKIWTKRIIECC